VKLGVVVAMLSPDFNRRKSLESTTVKSPPPILVVDLFPRLDAHLIDLLRGLSAGEWNAPTVCAGWSVKDVAAHLLDTAWRRLSIHRDRYVAPDAPREIATPAALGEYINRLNGEFVTTFRRTSPELLIELLAVAGAELYQFFQSLDPFAPAQFAVSWAGDTESPCWFDVAREFTERWHHQEQIRDATHRPPLRSREFLAPVIDTFMRALPFAYRDVAGPQGTTIRVQVTGEAGGDWYLVRDGGAWKLAAAFNGQAAATIRVADDMAWRLVTKGLDRTAGEPMVAIEGDERLGKAFGAMRCVVG
jgi:uncharacterized protein (TIGR03083 family)